MFARLSRQSARWVDVRVEHALSSDDDAISIDVNVLTCLDLSWRGLCGRTIEPVYRGLKSVVEEDLNTVVKLLSELDSVGEGLERTNENVQVPPQPQPPLPPGPRVYVAEDSALSCADVSLPERPRRKRRRSSALVEPLVIKPTHPSAPTIIISPCPSQARETSSWVPYQDASFGARLTVPTYAPFNGAFPPLVTPSDLDNRVDDWMYVDGHWCAILPTQDEQCRRGLYSRSVSRRRSRLRPPCRTDV
ncbi:uncharacterized protein EDB91DRAFT_1242042 [Suillus paluster]|uniref:uncharacterized protein n=1 Tax=Suillus paluster TaxID=48578 RepID=UPI001B85CAD7|nr:uncharacterized protein EDB91DRAFT_1242042 [Suillus paluster]KAG1754804.1 hypothetical protein EDB91DRAFT_1242042 [Suillus paluster]